MHAPVPVGAPGCLLRSAQCVPLSSAHEQLSATLARCLYWFPKVYTRSVRIGVHTRIFSSTTFFGDGLSADVCPRQDAERHGPGRRGRGRARTRGRCAGASEEGAGLRLLPDLAPAEPEA